MKNKAIDKNKTKKVVAGLQRIALRPYTGSGFRIPLRPFNG